MVDGFGHVVAIGVVRVGIGCALVVGCFVVVEVDEQRCWDVGVVEWHVVGL